MSICMYVCMYVFCVYKLLPYKTRSLSVPHTCLSHIPYIHTYIHTYIQADSLSKEFHKSLVVNMSLKEELLKLRRRHEEVISTFTTFSEIALQMALSNVRYSFFTHTPSLCPHPAGDTGEESVQRGAHPGMWRRRLRCLDLEKASTILLLLE